MHLQKECFFRRKQTVQEVGKIQARNVYRILVWNFVQKLPLGRPTNTRVSAIKTILRK